MSLVLRLLVPEEKSLLSTRAVLRSEESEIIINPEVSLFLKPTHHILGERRVVHLTACDSV